MHYYFDIEGEKAGGLGVNSGENFADVNPTQQRHTIVMPFQRSYILHN